MIVAGSFSGHFDLMVHDADTGHLIRHLSFPNLITNQGLASYCGASPSFYTAKICVGNGTTEPDVNDTNLANFLASSNTNLGSGTFNGGSSNLGAPDYISQTNGTARFNAGVFDGTTITEIGVCNGTASNPPVFSRALILDEFGKPTSLTILANEYLDVKYTLYYHPDLGDTQFSFVMDGVTYNCTARAANVNSNAFDNSGGASPIVKGAISISYVYNTQTLGEVTGQPVYSSGGRIELSINPAGVAYSTDMPYTHRNKVTIGTGAGNFAGGIGAMYLANYYSNRSGILSRTQVVFDPKLPKDANTEMTFTLAKTVSRYVAPTP